MFADKTMQFQSHYLVKQFNMTSNACSLVLVIYLI